MNLIKLTIGIATVIAIVMIYPILDMLQTFFTIVMVPLVFLVALGMISESSYELLRNTPSRLKDKIEDWRSEMKNAETAA